MWKINKKTIYKALVASTLLAASIGIITPFLISCSSTSDSTGTSNNPSTQTQTTTFTSEDKVFEVFHNGADNHNRKYDLAEFDDFDFSIPYMTTQYNTFLDNNQSAFPIHGNLNIDNNTVEAIVQIIYDLVFNGYKESIVKEPYLVKNPDTSVSYFHYIRNKEYNVELANKPLEPIPFTPEEQKYWDAIGREKYPEYDTWEEKYSSGKIKISYIVNEYWDNGQLIKDKPLDKTIILNCGNKFRIL